MSRGLNKVLLIGNLGRDAESKHTPSGVAVSNFSIATARRVKDQSGEWRDDTDWHDIVLWRGENVAPYLLKGTRVYIEGRLQTRSWEAQDGTKKYRTEVVVDGNQGLMLLSGDKSRPDTPTGRDYPPKGPVEDLEISDDDVPF